MTGGTDTMTQPPARDLDPDRTQDLGLNPAGGLDQVAGPDTGPILILTAQGLSTRQISRRLHISQSSVQRKLARLRLVLNPGSEDAARSWLWLQGTWRIILAVAFTLSLAVIAAALATLAWR